MSKSNEGDVTFVKRFTLHDGEDEKKTQELHDFLQAPRESGLLADWEGNPGGITMWIDARPGDEISRSPDGNFISIRRTT
jgi:hypothetical protein